MTLTATFLLLAAAACGTALLARYDAISGKVLRVLAGTVLGLCLLALAAYLATLALPLTKFLAASLALAMAALALRWWRRSPHPATPEETRSNTHLPVVFFLLLALTLAPAAKLLVAEPDGWATHAINAYGDLGLHVAMIAGLQNRHGLLPENPILAGEPLIYPFMSNLLTATLAAAGLTIPRAVTLTAILLIPIAFTLLYALAHALLGSRPAAVITVLLLLLGGSNFGWVQIFQDMQESQQSLTQLLAHLPRNYTGHGGDDRQYNLVNVIISMLLPQRSFLLGFPLALLMLLLLYDGTHRHHRASLVLAGLTAGLLPLFHAHTALALSPLLIFWMTTHRSRDWLLFVGTTALAGLPAVAYYLAGNATAGVIPRLQWWWMAHGTNPILFWLKNSGLLIPLTLAGLLLPAPRLSKVFAVGGLSLFAAANIWRFAPWEWDNTKLLVWWLILTAPLLGWTLWQTLCSRQPLWVAGGAILLLTHLTAGSLDLLRLSLPTTTNWVIWDSAALKIASAIQQQVPAGAPLLTAPIHNSPAAIAGRPVYLGFPGHVWTHGGAYLEREASIGPFYRGEVEALPDLTPAYILAGPAELDHATAIQIRPDWQLLADTGAYQLYRRPVATR